MKKVLLTVLILLLSIIRTGAVSHVPLIVEEKKEGKDEGANSTFSYDIAQKLLVIRFIEAEMAKTQPDVIEHMKVHCDYTFDAEFALPEELCKALGSQQLLIIKKGSYPMTYKDGIYSIYVQY